MFDYTAMATNSFHTCNYVLSIIMWCIWSEEKMPKWKDYKINLAKYLIFEEKPALGLISMFAFHFAVIIDLWLMRHKTQKSYVSNLFVGKQLSLLQQILVMRSFNSEPIQKE